MSEIAASQWFQQVRCHFFACAYVRSVDGDWMDSSRNRGLALAMMLVLVAPPPTRAEVTWAVVAGDTLASIADRAGVAVDSLRSWNALDGDRIRVGQELRLAPPAEAPATGPTYTIKLGDTLSVVAKRLGMSLADLGRMNPELDVDHIREGQVLRVGESRRKVRHRIAQGENLSQLATRFEVRVADILRANPGVRADHIRAGQTLTIFTDVPDSRSESVGTPSEGRLLHAARLSPHPGYLIRDRERAFGTAELVHGVRKVFDEFLERFPDSPKVEIHDLSLPTGGRMADHRSHQSGRDVDIAYIYKGCRPKGCEFKRVGADDLDTKRQWALLKPWLENGMAEAIFIDYSLQRALYNEARREGATRDELALWFQYPRGRTFPLGVIRHIRAHADHMHVRVACHETDGECKTLRPLLMRAQHASR